jgi:hypothetical protein
MQCCRLESEVSSAKAYSGRGLATHIPTMTSSSIFGDEFRLRTWSATIDEAALSLPRANFWNLWTIGILPLGQ